MLAVIFPICFPFDFIWCLDEQKFTFAYVVSCFLSSSLVAHLEDCASPPTKTQPVLSIFMANKNGFLHLKIFLVIKTIRKSFGEKYEGEDQTSEQIILSSLLLSHTKFYKCICLSLFPDFFVWIVIGCLPLPLCRTAVINGRLFFFSLTQKQYGWDDNFLENYCPRLKCFPNIDAS